MRTRAKQRSAAPSVVWFRNDLRLADNPALDAAIRRGAPILPVFIWAPEEEGDWRPGAATRWWLHQSLKQLDTALRAIGTKLVLRNGPTVGALHKLIREAGAKAVYWNRRYEPVIHKRDRLLSDGIRACGCSVEISNGGLLSDPATVTNKSGRPFQVFTPYWKTCLHSLEPPQPLRAPKNLPLLGKPVKSVPLVTFGLEPTLNWSAGLANAWHPGEAGATLLLDQFCAEKWSDYRLNRNRPDLSGTSRLSPHLHFGEISPNQIWQALKRRHKKLGHNETAWRNGQFVAELGWREFAHYLLWHFPQTPARPLRETFERFPWRHDPGRLKAWQKGKTGYPMVDAGMRELWATGWMHNRARMVAASFLVKDLLVPWQEGARWFWDTLVDADLANNTLGWQWTAGCGADAAPFFRIFNPVTQGLKSDPQGEYVRRWIPELAALPTNWIHRPWQAPAHVLTTAGVGLGNSYPLPIVDHNTARARALAAFSSLRQ